MRKIVLSAGLLALLAGFSGGFSGGFSAAAQTTSNGGTEFCARASVGGDYKLTKG